MGHLSVPLRQTEVFKRCVGVQSELAGML
uniref:Uncharacterized protein n=1 Tax=Anguilla anguilla TaxID=7936 RepID=A0A0E9W5R5_ANGAN